MLFRSPEPAPNKRRSSPSRRRLSGGGSRREGASDGKKTSYPASPRRLPTRAALDDLPRVLPRRAPRRTTPGDLPSMATGSAGPRVRPSPPRAPPAEALLFPASSVSHSAGGGRPPLPRAGRQRPFHIRWPTPRRSRWGSHLAPLGVHAPSTGSQARTAREFLSLLTGGNRHDCSLVTWVPLHPSRQRLALHPISRLNPSRLLLLLLNPGVACSELLFCSRR